MCSFATCHHTSDGMDAEVAFFEWTVAFPQAGVMVLQLYRRPCSRASCCGVATVCIMERHDGLVASN